MDQSSSLQGKIALITGAARGQGRSHAIRLAEAGADIIAVDICRQIEIVGYPMGTSEDLAQTVAAVKSLDRRIVAAEVDVRDAAALREAVDDGAEQLGGVDIVLANAGIAPGGGSGPDPERAFRDIVEVNLFGVWNTVHAAAPRMIEQGRGGAIVLTSSTQGLTGRGGNGDGGLEGYCASKHGVVGLMRTFAHWLAPHSIRVNTVHPTGVDTPMIMNEALQAHMAANPALGEAMSNLMPVPVIESIDVTNAVLWLVSDAARFVTGVALPVDAGFAIK
ncbi:mycofactocin-coupled SDR family oxidoreductase [Pseudonocardia nigra]|uniref:mycofactocin-coupled SDR family oxidoreductase n=1 Tax=Pseudonocardia nigra TaxID=1921578 RepID=UPI001C5D0BBA|nr:mycofactocin-coupled SDR family oxidoreductase [Pseudonocardia nigra]